MVRDSLYGSKTPNWKLLAGFDGTIFFPLRMIESCYAYVFDLDLIILPTFQHLVVVVLVMLLVVLYHRTLITPYFTRTYVKPRNVETAMSISAGPTKICN